MSDDPRMRPGPEEDEALSALVDGELAEDDAASLRARVAEEPVLAERLAAFERVDDALRALPRELPADDLRERLQDRIVAEGAEGAAPDDVRRLPAWGGAALAAAAAVAVYLAMTPVVEEPEGSRPSSELAAVEVVLSEASEEELAIARDYETLADIEVLEDLELLELMIELEESDGAERGERG